MSGTATVYKTVIGLEVHVQLASTSKLFCRCEARFGAPPNALVCAVCTGQPGVLPVLDGEALRLGVLAGLALGCTIDPATKFDRKNYFYPDLPKGYQISQYDRPLCRDGALEVPLPGGATKRVSIMRAHLEEDSGKIIHPEGLPLSLVDLNRAGMALLEIVSGPDLSSPEEAGAYLQTLRRALRYAGASECDMEKGGFRCDANISLRPAGSARLGTRTEIKNLNSFRFVMQALQAEIDRQTQVLRAGGAIVQQTMAFDPASGRTAAMRSKEQADDYRYFPEPDLPEFAVPPDWVAALRASMPEAPAAREARLRDVLGLPARDAEALTAERELADYFEQALAAAGPGVPAATVASFVQTDALRLCNERKRALGELALTGKRLGGVVRLVHDGALSVQAARAVILALEEAPGESALDAARRLDLVQLSDTDALGALVERVLAEESDLVARHRAGKPGLFNALLGAVMKASGGKANPAAVRELLERALRAP